MRDWEDCRSFGCVGAKYWAMGRELYGCVKPLKSIKRGCWQAIRLTIYSCYFAKITPLDEIREWSTLYNDQPIKTTALHMNLRDPALTHKHLKRVSAQREDATQTHLWSPGSKSHGVSKKMLSDSESSSLPDSVIVTTHPLLRPQPKNLWYLHQSHLPLSMTCSSI